MKATALSAAFGEIGGGDGGAAWMARCSSSRAMPRTMKNLESARAMKAAALPWAAMARGDGRSAATA